jgi:hypothetical protein
VVASPHIIHKIEAPSLSLEELDVSAQHLQPAATITTTSMGGKKKFPAQQREIAEIFLNQQQPWDSE